MSAVIWGSPLVTRETESVPPSLLRNDLSDLNNWTKRNLNNSLTINYDSSSRTNTYSYTMVSSSHERLMYALSVKRGTMYHFSMEFSGSYEEERNMPGTFMWVAVCNKIPNNSYLESQQDIIIVGDKPKPDRVNKIQLDFMNENLDTVYLLIDMSACTDGKEASFTIKNISCIPNNGEPISYAQKPFNLNILNGEVWNFIAVAPGAWFYSIFDSRKTHHTYFLSGDEFKLLEFQDADGNGVIPHKEYRSTPITIKGRQYYSLHLSRTVDSVCPFPTKYYLIDEMPSDEEIYSVLTEYVCEWAPYDRGDVLGLLALRNLLSANSGDVNVDLDDLKAMLKGYTVEERQNPYLDDPNLDDTGHPTVSYHD